MWGRSFANNISHKVSNGRKISFWNGSWVGSQPLEEIYPDLFNLTQAPDATIHETSGQQGWIINFRRLLTDWEINRIAKLFQVLEQFIQGTTANEDRLDWKHRRCKSFTRLYWILVRISSHFWVLP